ncbi:MAG: hypothetical protein ACD_76C00068G0021 [uncultured bacterium]|nr:MAG: hypothetical protein ACD_76C00068G0021 [uncultured bacterium]
MNEIIYILINEAMPGYVKIGRTTNLEQRIRSLDTTSVPLPFECFYACTVKDAVFVRSLQKNRNVFVFVNDQEQIKQLNYESIKYLRPDKLFAWMCKDGWFDPRKAAWNFKKKRDHDPRRTEYSS